MVGRWRIVRALLVAGQAIVLVLGIVTVIAGHPGPPVSSAGLSEGQLGGHVGTHYSFWSVLTVRGTFTASGAEVKVTGAGCQADLRLLSPAETARLQGKSGPTGVSSGPLPGTSLDGHEITPALARQIAVVITSTKTGRCDATQVRVAKSSGFTDGWTSVPVRLYTYVAFAHGSDPRAK